MDNSTASGDPDLFSVVRDVFESAPAGIQTLKFPADFPSFRVASPGAVHARLRDFVKACRPAPNAGLTLEASGCWPGRRVTVVRLTLTSTDASGKRQCWSVHMPIRSTDGEPRPTTPVGRKRRALVVDDEPVSRRLTAGLLQSLGCDTAAVDNGLEAIEHATSGNFDVIFMDCDMPRLSGYETTAGIRRMENVYTPIVAVTATIPGGWPARTKCLQAGMDDYLAKPVAASDLKCALEWWAPVSEFPAA